MDTLLKTRYENWRIRKDKLYRFEINEVLLEYDNEENEDYYLDEVNCFEKIQDLQKDFRNNTGIFEEFFNYEVYESLSYEKKLGVLINEISIGLKELTNKVKLANTQISSIYDLTNGKQEFDDLNLEGVNHEKLIKVFKLRISLIEMEINSFERDNAEVTAIFLSTIYEDLLEDVRDCRNKK